MQNRLDSKRRPASIEVWRGGSLLRIRRERSPSPGGSNSVGGPRGKVVGFTRESRRRLLRTIAQLDRCILPLFVTLTYPGRFSTNYKDWKRDLKVWSDRLRRAYDGASFIWRLELQKRGAPHFHLLLYGVPTVDQQIKEWLSSSWYNVVRSGDINHLRAGTNIQTIRTHRGTMAYSSKELGKITQTHLSETYSAGVGRWWGAYNRKSLPLLRSTSVELSEDQAVRLLRIARRYANLRYKSRAYQSLTIFCDADAWWQRLPELTGESIQAGITLGLRRLDAIQRDINGSHL